MVAVLIIMVFLVVITAFWTRWIIEENEARRELREENPSWWVPQPRHRYTPPPPTLGDEYLILPTDKRQEDIIPKDKHHVSTTINYDTGEITEKWKAE